MTRKSATGNKQRITRLTRRERLAAVTGGALDDSIPIEAWGTRLRDEPGHEFDLHQLSHAAWSEIAICRGFHIPGHRGPVVPPRLEPNEVRAQAAATLDVIDELRERLDNFHPELQMRASSALWGAHGEGVFEVAQRLEQDLLRLRAAMAHAQSNIAPGKTGPKETPWHAARAALAAELIQHSIPPMRAPPASALAEDLLDLCGLARPGRAKSGT